MAASKLLSSLKAVLAAVTTHRVLSALKDIQSVRKRYSIQVENAVWIWNVFQ